MTKSPPPDDDQRARGFLQFDSDTLPEKARFRAYRELYAGGTDAEQLGPDFHARVSAWSLDRLTIFERHLNDVGHHRTPAHVAHDQFDHFTITLVIAGEVEVDHGAGFTRVPPGCGIIYDAHKPARNRFRRAHLYLLRVSRPVFQELASGQRDPNGALTKPGTTALLTDYVRVLLPRLNDLDLVGSGHAVDALFALVRGALQPARTAADTAARARDQARLTTIRALIEASINDPDLGPEMIVARSDVSRATLYRLFKPLGGINGYIRARRLHALRLSLMDPREQRTFAELALHWGFHSEAHASRLFVDHYGTRPGSYREGWRASRDTPAPVREMRFLEATINEGSKVDQD